MRLKDNAAYVISNNSRKSFKVYDNFTYNVMFLFGSDRSLSSTTKIFMPTDGELSSFILVSFSG